MSLTTAARVRPMLCCTLLCVAWQPALAQVTVQDAPLPQAESAPPAAVDPPPAGVPATEVKPGTPLPKLPEPTPDAPPLAAQTLPATPAPASACVKSDFETVVDQSAEALRGLNALKKPVFQDKLRQLKERRSWTQDQFLKEAAPFVKDDEIDVFDKKSNDLLVMISTMGEEGSAAKSPDCTVLKRLRVFMNQLVDTQNAKWTYMFSKIDGELTK